MAPMTGSGLATSVAERVADVRARMAAAGGDPDAIRLVAVTKGFGSDVVGAARRAGLEDLGENYAQELLAKAAAAEASTDGSGPPGPLRWHFLGAPQRNKLARLAPVVALWQAVDRPAVIDRLSQLSPGAAILVQVNVIGDPAKAGCAPCEAPGLVERARAGGLEARGLMCVGPAGDPDLTRRAFARLAAEARVLEVDEVSMGMSDDFEIAVAEGSTMVRLGRALFGPRPGSTGVRR
jgi:pyridoxal phosphate enzyme (YggS family)